MNDVSLAGLVPYTIYTVPYKPGYYLGISNITNRLVINGACHGCPLVHNQRLAYLAYVQQPTTCAQATLTCWAGEK
jgi:hypothetical protein